MAGVDPDLLARLSAKSAANTDLQKQLEVSGSNAVEGLSEVPPNLVQQAQQALQSFDPKDQQTLRGHLKSYVTTRQRLAQTIGQTAGTARATGAPELAKDLASAGREVNQPDPNASIWDKGKYAGKVLMDALDVPAHAVRAVTMPGGPSWSGSADRKDWEDALKKSDGTAAKVFRGATNAVASIPAAAATGLTVGANRLLGGPRGTKEAAQESFDDYKEKFGDFLRETVTDPLTFVSSGLGGEAGNASRVAKRLTKDADVAREVGNVVRAGRTPETFGKVVETMGVPLKKAEQAFGKGGSFLGKGQLRVGLPGTDVGVDVLPTLTGKEYLGGKALEGAYSPVRKAAEYMTGSKLRPLFDPAKEQLENAGRAVRGGVATSKNQIEKEVEALAELAPTDRARRIEILQRHIDPAHHGEVVTQKIATGLGREKEIQVPDNYLPFEQLAPNEQQWVNGLQDFFGRRHEELVRSGLLEPKQVGKNAATGQYFPRNDPGRVGLLDVRGKAQMEAVHPKPGFLQERGADIPIGARPEPQTIWDKRALAKMDPTQVAAQYGRQSAEAVGRRRFEAAVAEQFGTPKPVPNWSQVKNAQGEVRYVPPEVAEHVNATFDRTWTSVANMLRAAGAADHPAGRAVVGALDVVKALGDEFKRNVTSKVPGFHVVNAANDVLQMQAVAGVNNPVKWFKRAGEVLEGTTPQARTLRELAFSNNVGTEAEAGLGQHGRELFLAGQQRGPVGLNMESIKGAAERGEASIGQRAKLAGYQALHTADTAGDRFGNFWRSRAEMATFLARLDRGDSPQTAAKFVGDALLDYGAPGRMTQALTSVFPFAKFMTKAPVMAAKAAIRNPGVVNMQQRLTHAMIGTDQPGFDPKQNVKERGPYEQLGEGGKGLASRAWNLMLSPERALGLLPSDAGTIRPGYGATLSTRLPIAESMAPEDITLPGNEAWAQALNPMLKALYEARSGQDLLTKQPLKLDPTFGMAGRYLAPALLSPMTLNMLNSALYWAGGGPQGGSLNRLGSMRDYAEDPAQQRAAERWNMLTRFPVTLTDPTVALDTARRKAQQAVDPARATIGTAKRILKQNRK